MSAVPAVPHCNDRSAPTSINMMPCIHVMMAHGAHIVHDVYTRHNGTERVKDKIYVTCSFICLQMDHIKCFIAKSFNGELV